MKLSILEEAQLELEESVDYYNNECPGLGYEFADEVYRTFDRIVDNPDAWHPLSARSRRCLLHRFPFGVIYQYKGDSILVVAVMHLHRLPGIWKNRTGNP